MQGERALFTERELSDWIGLSQPTLSRLRRDGTGPKFIRLSERRIGYRIADVEEWLASRATDRINASAQSREAK